MKYVIITDKHGSKYYYVNNKFHREDGPAVEYADGIKVWYKNGLYHREDGPAIEYSDGNRCWYLNGLYHREDGPAIEYSDGNRCWYLNNKKYGYNNDFTNESWKKFVKTLIFS